MRLIYGFDGSSSSSSRNDGGGGGGSGGGGGGGGWRGGIGCEGAAESQLVYIDLTA